MRNQILAAVAVLMILVLVAVVIQQRRLLAEQQSRIDDLAWTLKDGTAVPSVTTASPDAVDAVAKDGGIDMAGVKKDAAKSETTVQGVTTSTAATPGKKEEGLASTGETPRPAPLSPLVPTSVAPIVCPAPVESPHMRATQHLRLDEPLGGGKQAPWGRASFSAWEAKPWSLEVYPRAYQSTTVIATNEDGAMKAYTKLRLLTQGETHDLEVTSGSTVITRPEARFRFSPALYMGVDGGFSLSSFAWTAAPIVQLGIFSYGQTKLAPDYALVLIGAGYATASREPMLAVSPVSVNLGALLPIVDNLHLVPTFGLSLSGEKLVLAGVRAKF